jgi:hypothetical protein
MKVSYKETRTLEKKMLTPNSAHFAFPPTGLLTVGLHKKQVTNITFMKIVNAANRKLVFLKTSKN